MKASSTTSKTINNNQAMVMLIFLIIGLVFVIYGLAVGSTSIITGGVITLLSGFFFFGLPRFLGKK